MKTPVEIGRPSWTNEDLVDKLAEFARLYRDRPIRDNRFGMKSPHLFATWFVAQWMKPECIIESGVWKGQGSWALSKGAPDAHMHCIDPKLKHVVFKPEHARYYKRDFATIDWGRLPKERTLVFIDDHQDAEKRLYQIGHAGFRYVMFEDNYPPGRGNCRSLKQILETEPGAWIRDTLRVYYEFAPVHVARKTRWGDFWSNYATKMPLLQSPQMPYTEKLPILQPALDVDYLNETRDYTWICYCELGEIHR